MFFMHKLPSKTFGQAVAKARMSTGRGLRDVAPLILKEDGKAISFQYLSGIENDRRNPPSDHLIDQIAIVLGVSRYYLYIHGRRIPPDFPVTVDAKEADKVYERTGP
jgi:transcriptional regulator with XRE-family HTH domain